MPGRHWHAPDDKYRTEWRTTLADEFDALELTNDERLLLTAEACAQQIIGTSFGYWIPDGNTGWAIQCRSSKDELTEDALRTMICGENRLVEALVYFLGKRGEALNQFLNDAFEGELSERFSR